jgi:hypothetical protein
MRCSCCCSARREPASRRKPPLAAPPPSSKPTLPPARPPCGDTWIETTSVLVNGSEKSNKQKSVYYGANGSLHKLGIASSPAPRQKPGLRGAVATAKKEELTDYMQAAVALVKTYLPLDPNAIQAAMASGRVSVDALDPGRRVRMNMKNYRIQSDSVAVEFAIAANRPLGITISTYLQDPSQVVLLTAGMGRLADGTTFASNITLAAAAKNLLLNVLNSGHRKLPQRAARR